MIGYFYDIEENAMSAISAIDAHFGYPAEGMVTKSYTEHLPWGDGWAIMADDSIVAVLGDAVELPEIDELTTNND